MCSLSPNFISIRKNIAVFVTDFLRSLKTNNRPTRAERAVQTPIAPRSWNRPPLVVVLAMVCSGCATLALVF